MIAHPHAPADGTVDTCKRRSLRSPEKGEKTSCTGPDREWAQCVMDAEDACTAMCD